MKHFLLLIIISLFMAGHCSAQEEIDYRVKKKPLVEESSVFPDRATYDRDTAWSSSVKQYFWYSKNEARTDTNNIIIWLKLNPVKDTMYLSVMPVISGDKFGVTRGTVNHTIESFDISIEQPDKKNAVITLNATEIDKASALMLAEIRTKHKGRAIISNLIYYLGSDAKPTKLNKTLLILP